MIGISRPNPSARKVLRASLVCMSSIAAICAVTAPASVAAQNASSQQRTVSIDIPRQSMADALRAFARQVDKQIVFYSGDAEDLTAGPISGTFTEQDALRRILGQSGLDFIYVNDRTIGIGRRGAQGRLIAASGQSEDLP